MSRRKKSVIYLILLLLIPATVLLGAVVFREKHYAWISFCVAAFSCVPLWICFERKESTAKELAVLAVMIALSSVGRFAFAWLPGIKPVTAVTVIAAIWLGKEAGFAVGSLSAVVSDFYFGQGPWTPFQMFAWGLIGFLAGCLAAPLKKNKAVLCGFGALSGVLFSLIMDVWTVLWTDGQFRLPRYIATVLTALPVTAEYAVSNLIFLLLLAKPIGEKLERLIQKYGLFVPSGAKPLGLDKKKEVW